MRNLKILLLLAAFINAITWIILIPVWQYPDEQSHFAQVQNIAEFGKSQLYGKNNTSYEIDLLERTLHTNRIDGRDNAYTYNPQFNIQYSNTLNGLEEEKFNNLPINSRTTLVKWEATENPPLYYFFGSLVYKSFYNNNIFERIYAIRVMSAIIFLGTIGVCFQISKFIFPKNSILQIILPFIISFKPMLVFASTGVLPDPLTNFLFSLVLLTSLKILSFSFRLKYLFFAIIITALGFLTRQQFVIAIPILLLAYFWKFQSKATFIIRIILSTILFYLIIFFIDKLTSVHFLSEFRLADIGIFNLKHVSIKTFEAYTKFSMETYYSQITPWYWGVYRWLSLTLPLNYYRIIKVIVTIALIGLAIGVYKTYKNKKTIGNHHNLVYLAAASFVYFALFFIGDYFFFINNGYSFGIQGRYFFPMVIAHLSLILAGLWIVLKIIMGINTKYILLLLLILQVIFNDLSLAHVAASYYSVETFSRFILEASQYKPSLLKGNIILYILILNITLQAVFCFCLTKKTFKNELS